MSAHGNSLFKVPLTTSFLSEASGASAAIGQWTVAEWHVSNKVEVKKGNAVVTVKSMERDLSIDLDAPETGYIVQSFSRGELFSPGQDLGYIKLLRASVQTTSASVEEIPMPTIIESENNVAESPVPPPPTHKNTALSSEETTDQLLEEEAVDLTEKPVEESNSVPEFGLDRVSERVVEDKSVRLLCVSILLTGAFLGMVVSSSGFGRFLSFIFFVILIQEFFKYWSGYDLLRWFKKIYHGGHP